MKTFRLIVNILYIKPKLSLYIKGYIKSYNAFHTI